jgi:hypothetical protein
MFIETARLEILPVKNFSDDGVRISTSCANTSRKQARVEPRLRSVEKVIAIQMRPHAANYRLGMEIFLFSS